jgi:L-alanine-DL-glutamate epimerase-like enolase superfamily enzyme
MKITGIRSRAVSVPLETPIVSAIRRTDRVELVVIEVLTDSELIGQSYVQAFGVQPARAIQDLLDYLAVLLDGENPMLTLRAYQLMERAINLLGRGGLATFALSGVDCALWDIVGKVAGMPVAALLGAAGDRCAAYESSGLWLQDPGQVLVEEAQRLIDAGVRGVKMRVGRPNADDDVEAVGLVREAIGPGPFLLIDANQGWSVGAAIALGRAFEPFQPFWLEEPVDHDDLTGHAAIAEALSVPVATGENIYLPRGFRQVIEARACDILMPDVQRVGGVTGWMRVAALAQAWNLPIASHLFPEISIHLLAASPTAQLIELMPWAQPIMAEPLILQDGSVVVPPRPGLGLVFDNAAIDRYSLG